MDSIAVIGGGGHAKVVTSILKKRGFRVVGYTDKRDRGALLGAPYLGEDEILTRLIRRDPACQAALGTGKTDASATRMALQRRIHGLGYRFPTVASPDAVVNEEVVLGSGTVVFDGAVVNSGTVVGDWSILNTNCTVEHDCAIGENVHVAPGAVVGGGVTIGDNTMVGAGATVLQGLSLCAGCLVGAGAVVVDDLVTPGTYVGTPAKRIA